MSALNATAKAALNSHGVSQAEWARHNFMSDGRWCGDACGCPDDRCIGYHHDGPDDCGCLPVLLAQLPAGEGIYAESRPACPEPVRARDVQVRKLHRAECCRDGCGWTGGEHATYQDANTERLAHFNQHILAEG